MQPPRSRQIDVGRVVWVTPAVNLYVVGVLVCRQTLSLDDVDNVGSVHHEQERAQYGSLWHDKLDDGRCRLLAAVTRVLTTLVQVRAKPRQDGVVQTKLSSQTLDQDGVVHRVECRR